MLHRHPATSHRVGLWTLPDAMATRPTIACSITGYAYIVFPAKHIAASPRGSARTLGQQSHLQPKDRRLSLATTSSLVAPTFRTHAIEMVIFPPNAPNAGWAAAAFNSTFAAEGVASAILASRVLRLAGGETGKVFQEDLRRLYGHCDFKNLLSRGNTSRPTPNRK